MIQSLRPAYPDEDSCLAIARRFRMPENIVRHSRTVCGVALYLLRKLEEHHVHLDAGLVRSSALLHDITKRHSFNRPLDHALTGSKLLKHLGYKQIASVVRQHVRVSRSRPPGRVSEVEVVNYADKRVVDDRIVTLEERLEYIRGRYGRSPEAMAAIEMLSETAFTLEKDIFDVLPGGPEQIQHIEPLKECGRI